MKMRVVDFFCGAGGFSEGFRQQGFELIQGIDNWKPAIDTHNLNFGLNDSPKNILDFEGSVEDIENFVLDSEVLIGSPPCVSFSMANKAGKADKSLGIRLIEAYLRVVVIKKHKKGTILKAWYMENVPNSRNFVKESYSFEDLNLTEWAEENKLAPKQIAINVKNSGDILCAADYGSPQTRDRFVCGEFIQTGKFLAPVSTHKPLKISSRLHDYITLKDIKGKMPPTSEKKKTSLWKDPNYPELTLTTEELTDHFYDTGVYKLDWENARELKVNHPFMGRMSFPEDENRPSRTIMATRSASTRESLIYKSEYKRSGDGEYRMPTIREAATLMGFPFVYQFTGKEGTKWKLIGNAVCPHMSSAIAKVLRKTLKLKDISNDNIDFSIMLGNFKKVENLNTFKEAEFNSPRKRGKSAKFRRHPIKAGNMTVSLTNYHPLDYDISPIGEKWYTSVFLGSGSKYQVKQIEQEDLKLARELIVKNFKDGVTFVAKFEDRFSKLIGTPSELQEMYEMDKSKENLLEPTTLIKEFASFIQDYSANSEKLSFNGLRLIPKDEIPKSQLLAIYALARISNNVN